jgi:hypothetical protein
MIGLQVEDVDCSVVAGVDDYSKSAGADRDWIHTSSPPNWRKHDQT